MLIVISPAKSLDYETPSFHKEHSHPRLLDQSERIMDSLKKKSANRLIKLQGISKSLAELNYERNQNWTPDHSVGELKEALMAFKGDVYQGINADDFDTADMEFAQSNLRILSGLYGLLRPLDLMKPYRLEMGTALSTTRGKNLYDFWKLRITDLLESDLVEGQHEVLVNLASDEYFKSIKAEKLKVRVVQPTFMDKKNGKYKVLSFFAKKARGMMVRFAVKNRIEEVDELKTFDTDGYLFNEELSSDNKWVFTRDQE